MSQLPSANCQWQNKTWTSRLNNQLMYNRDISTKIFLCSLNQTEWHCQTYVRYDLYVIKIYCKHQTLYVLYNIGSSNAHKADDISLYGLHCHNKCHHNQATWDLNKPVHS